ncbi:MAG: hypothetical protein IK079_05690 [Desulfovibrio sp.]|nr:hypothetical protein [Desulfovibrio sp.]
MADESILKAGSVIIQRGIEQVYERGRRVGLREARQQIAKNLINMHFSKEQILGILGVNEEEYAKLMHAQSPNDQKK